MRLREVEGQVDGNGQQEQDHPEQVRVFESSGRLDELEVEENLVPAEQHETDDARRDDPERADAGIGVDAGARRRGSLTHQPCRHHSQDLDADDQHEQVHGRLQRQPDAGGHGQSHSGHGETPELPGHRGGEQRVDDAQPHQRDHEHEHSPQPFVERALRQVGGEVDLEIDDDEGGQGRAEDGEIQVRTPLAVEQEQDQVQRREGDQQAGEQPLVAAVGLHLLESPGYCFIQRAECQDESGVRARAVEGRGREIRMADRDHVVGRGTETNQAGLGSAGRLLVDGGAPDAAESVDRAAVEVDFGGAELGVERERQWHIDHGGVGLDVHPEPADVRPAADGQGVGPQPRRRRLPGRIVVARGRPLRVIAWVVFPPTIQADPGPQLSQRQVDGAIGLRSAWRGVPGSQGQQGQQQAFHDLSPDWRASVEARRRDRVGRRAFDPGELTSRITRSLRPAATNRQSRGDLRMLAATDSSAGTDRSPTHEPDGEGNGNTISGYGSR